MDIEWEPVFSQRWIVCIGSVLAYLNKAAQISYELILQQSNQSLNNFCNPAYLHLLFQVPY